MKIDSEATRVAVDIGGTFTDVTVVEPRGGTIKLGKSLTTPDRLSDGVMDALDVAGVDLSDVSLIVHGSTVTINALIERKGARTALVTTRGTRDVYEIGRANRPDSYNLRFKKHSALVPREWIVEAHERLSAEGDVVHELTPEEVQRVANVIGSLEVEAVAVVSLHSYREPAHEKRLRDGIASAHPDLYLTASHTISREYREYERTSTAVANAYVGPRVSAYLRELEERLRGSGFGGELLLMQSAGGLCDIGTTVENCIQLMESGPAGGAVGVAALSKQLDLGEAIALDMGGTTAKACVVTQGGAALASDYFVGGYNEGLAIRTPVIDITEIGTGGGSIAWVDGGDGLRVGPRSAGASPGPVCFSRGGEEPTITDAHAVLGRLGERSLISGRMTLDVDSAREVIERRVGKPLGLSAHRAAAGIVAVANAAMANAVRAVTLNRGLDPRAFALVAYGGAGPLHAVEVARELGMEKVVVPPSPGHFSARGMLMADLRRDYAQTDFATTSGITTGEMREVFAALEKEGVEWFAQRGVDPSGVDAVRSVDMRYVGQEHTVNVPCTVTFRSESDIAGLKSRFDQIHDRLFSHSAPAEDAEFVTFRSSLVSPLPKTPFAHAEGDADPTVSPTMPDRAVYLGDEKGVVDIPVWWRGRLVADTTIPGPALVQEEATSTYLPSGASATVGSAGELIISVGTDNEGGSSNV